MAPATIDFRHFFRNLIEVHLLPEHQRRALLAREAVQQEYPNDVSTLDDLYEEFVYSKYSVR